MEDMLKQILSKLGSMKNEISSINTRLESLENKVDGLDTKVDSLDVKVDRISEKLDDLEAKNAENHIDIINTSNSIKSDTQELRDNQTSLFEMYGEHEVFIRTLRRKAL